MARAFCVSRVGCLQNYNQCIVSGNVLIIGGSVLVLGVLLCYCVLLSCLCRRAKRSVAPPSPPYEALISHHVQGTPSYARGNESGYGSIASQVRPPAGRPPNY